MALFNKQKDDAASDERAARRQARREARKNKNKGADESESGVSDKAVGSNRSRKDESVIREMVFETAVSLMKANKLFRVTRDDEDLYVGILMKFSDIGGLSKKDMKDESKGQIITLINSGGIASLFTADLKAKDSIVFIPNKNTLAQMSEFSLLADDLEYELVLVSAYDETIENTDVFVTLDYLQKCHASNRGVADKLTKVLEPAFVPGEDGYQAAAQPVNQEPVSQAPVESDTTYDDPERVFMEEESRDESDDDDYDDGYNDEYEGDENNYDDNYDAPDNLIGETPADDSGSSDELVGSDDTPSEDSQPVYLGADTSAMALSRKFFNDDMARELDTSALEQAIAGIGQFKALLMRPEDTWLNQQLNAMIDMANRELFALHQQNLDVVRNAYLNAIGSAYIDEMSQVQDYKNDKRYAEIADKVKEAKAGVDDLIKSERERLKTEWEQKVANAGEVAKINAEQTYRERYQYQYEERLRNVDAEVMAGLQAAENAAIADLKSVRQHEAQVRLDRLDSQKIDEAVKSYQALLTSEVELYAKHEAKLLQFLDDNREAEIARINVLNSELSRDEKIVQIQAEYKAKADALQADFEARISGLQADIDTARVRHTRDLADKDLAYQSLSAKYDADKAEWKSQIKELTDEVVRVNDSKTREVETRVAEMRAERDSYSQKYDHLVKTQKSTSMLLLALCGVAVLAALMVGIVVGGHIFNKDGENLPDTPPGVSDSVDLPSDASGEPDINNSENPGDSGDPGDAGDLGDAGDSGSDTSPETDPAWAAMQDPVI